MKKRLRKKLGNRYDLLRRAKRQKNKRKGRRYLAYDLVPIGKTDKTKLNNDGYTSYSYATHWFVEVVPGSIHYKQPYIVYVSPTTSKSKSHSHVFLQVNTVENPDDILLLFHKIVEDMKNDCFWDADYAAIFHSGKG